MKFISYILATCILLLTVSSVGMDAHAVSMTQQTETTCGDKCCAYQKADSKQKTEADKHNSKGCCSKGICNPCEQSVWSTGIIVKQLSCQLIDIAVPSEFSLPKPVNITSDYTSGCFHPPETV